MQRGVSPKFIVAIVLIIIALVLLVSPAERSLSGMTHLPVQDQQTIQNYVVSASRLYEIEQAFLGSYFHTNQIAEDPGAKEITGYYLSDMKQQNPLTSYYLVSVLDEFEEETFDPRWESVRFGVIHVIADLLSLTFPWDIRIYAGAEMPMTEKILEVSNRVASLYIQSSSDILTGNVIGPSPRTPWVSQLNYISLWPDPYSNPGGYPNDFPTTSGGIRNTLYPTQETPPQQDPTNPYNIKGGNNPISEETAYRDLAKRFGGTCYAWAMWDCNAELGDPHYQGQKTPNKFVDLAREVTGGLQLIVDNVGGKVVTYIGPLPGASLQEKAGYYHRRGYCVIRIPITLDNAAAVVAGVKNSRQNYPNTHDVFASRHLIVAGGHGEHVKDAMLLTDITQEVLQALSEGRGPQLPSDVAGPYQTAPLSAQYYDAIKAGDIRIFKARIKTRSWLKDAYLDVLLLVDRNGQIIKRTFSPKDQSNYQSAIVGTGEGIFEKEFPLGITQRKNEKLNNFNKMYITIVYPCGTTGGAQLPSGYALPAGTVVEVYNGVTREFDERTVDASGALIPPPSILPTPPSPPGGGKPCTLTNNICIDNCPRDANGNEQVCNSACTTCELKDKPKPQPDPPTSTGGKTP